MAISGQVMNKKKLTKNKIKPLEDGSRCCRLSARHTKLTILFVLTPSPSPLVLLIRLVRKLCDTKISTRIYFQGFSSGKLFKIIFHKDFLRLKFQCSVPSPLLVHGCLYYLLLFCMTVKASKLFSGDRWLQRVAFRILSTLPSFNPSDIMWCSPHPFLPCIYHGIPPLFQCTDNQGLVALQSLPWSE